MDSSEQHDEYVPMRATESDAETEINYSSDSDSEVSTDKQKSAQKGSKRKKKEKRPRKAKKDARRFFWCKMNMTKSDVTWKGSLPEPPK